MTTLTQEQINWLDKCAKGCTLNLQTGLVDVDGGFYCSNQGLKDFKGVKFGKVTGYFDCDNNSLTTLEGAPKRVGEYFSCSNNQLTSLVGAPKRVGEYFSCSNNQLTSLVGAPKRVGWYFNCTNNQLTSLVGAPQKAGAFYCKNNRLTSLEGAPLKVGGEFWCDANPVSAKTLVTIFDKMQEGHSFVIAAASLKNKMSEKDWKLIAPHIPEAIRPGVSMLARFGAFG
jgi:hypothetical protein